MKRNISYDLMRVVACLAVIMVHTAGTGLLPGHDYPIFTNEWYTCVVFSSLVGWAVPLFVMVSGAIFLDDKKEVSIRNIYRKNILRMLVVLAVWTMLYSWWIKGAIFPLGLTSAHLWYLPMTIALYMTVPVLKAIPWKVRDYFLMVWGVWILVDYICRFLEINPIAQFEHFFFTGYVGYFLLGDWCRRHISNARFTGGVIFGGVLSVAVIIVATIWYTDLMGKTSFLLKDYFSPLIVVIAMGMFYLCDILAKRMPKWLADLMTDLAPLTLGIYLIHMEILIQIYTRVQRFVPAPILLIPIVCGIAFVGGAVFTWVIKKIPYINKYIV